MKLKSFFICLLLISSLTAVKAQEQASVVMDKAFAQAKKENKKVFVMFHASWCGWCKKMDKAMESDACKDMFNANYVIAHLTVKESPKNANLENPGGEVILKKYKGEQAGLPFWVILDANGDLLADSFNAKGENLGCPSTPQEVADFTAKLKKTSKLNDKQLAVIANVFIIKK